jgi:hypothetical protein
MPLFFVPVAADEARRAPSLAGRKTCKLGEDAHVISVGFFMVRLAFPSVIERRTASRSMWWCDTAARVSAANFQS